MLAILGFLVGEGVEGTPFLLMPKSLAQIIITFIGAAEAQRAQIGWVDPADASYDKLGFFRDDHYPGDI